MIQKSQTIITLQNLRTQRDKILDLADKHGAFNVRVFGSVARGDATETSDVDFLVDVKPKTSIFELVALWLDLQELLGCDVNLSTDEGLKDTIKPSVLRDAVVL